MCQYLQQETLLQLKSLKEMKIFSWNQAYVLKTNKNTDTLQIVIYKTHRFCTKKLSIFHFIQTKTLKKPDFLHCLMEKIPLKHKLKESLIV